MIITPTTFNYSIETIKIDKFPVVIITDSHCHVKLLRDLKSLHPFDKFICLGDITDLFSKKDAFNKHSIEYFIENKIPCLRGNHEEHIAACDNFDNGETLYQFKAIPSLGQGGTLADEYRLKKHHFNYIKKLPTGFKLELPNGKHYLAYHHAPKDIWGFNDEGKLDDKKFEELYPLEENTIGVLHGHLHKPFVELHKKCNRYSLGAFKFKKYALLTENGIQYKDL